MLQLLCLLLILLPLTTLAQEFVPLVGIPFVDTNSVDSLGDYANAFYIAAISLGAVIAVLKIIFAGVKYMLSDVITDKSAAKADIKGALLGLILIIGAVLLLNTISPNITSLQAFNLNRLSITPPPPRPPVTPADQCPPGTQYEIVTGSPQGRCVSGIAVPGDQDFSQSPGEGQAQCGPSTTYNPTTNECDTITNLYAVPTYIIEERTLYCENDADCILLELRQWCATAFNDATQGYTYDRINTSCIPE